MHRRLLLILAVIAFAFVILTPSADACCRPCRGFCKPFTDPDTFCCTGIPEPDNACGLTTCGEWFPGRPHTASADEPLEFALPACSESELPAPPDPPRTESSVPGEPSPASAAAFFPVDES